MQEILENILNTEKSVKQLVIKAQEEASQLRAKTEASLAAELKAARDDAAAKVQNAALAARTLAKARRDEAVRKLHEQNDHFIDANSEKIGKLIVELTDFVISTDIEGSEQ